MDLNTSTPSTVHRRFPERRSSDMANSHQPTSSHATTSREGRRNLTDSWLQQSSAGLLGEDPNQNYGGHPGASSGEQRDASAIGSWKRLLRVFTEPERRTSRERRRGRDPLRCEDWSEGKRQTIRRAGDRG